MADFGFKKTNAEDEVEARDEHGEISPTAGVARDLERELGLGPKENPDAPPGSPAVQGGGIESEVGSTPPGTDPDR
jgi:hypothetical protein